MGVKTTSYAGQRRVFFILDRATRKFPGDLGLWMQHLTFARKQGANKKVARIITDVLRLHPAKPEVWVYAANYAFDEESDFVEARSYMQRGLRFCNRSKLLWCEYLRLEMMYIGKLSARRHILGLDTEGLGKNLMTDARKIDSKIESSSLLPLNAKNPLGEEKRLINPKSSVLAGSIPKAVFAAARREFPDDIQFGAQLFETVAIFHKLSCTKNVLQHFVDNLLQVAPQDPYSLSCFIRQPVVGFTGTEAEFPRELSSSIDRYESSIAIPTASKQFPNGEAHAIICRQIVHWILPFLRMSGMDPDIRKVLEAMLNQTWAIYQDHVRIFPKSSSSDFVHLLSILHSQGIERLVQPGLAIARQLWPDEEIAVANVGRQTVRESDSTLA